MQPIKIFIGLCLALAWAHVAEAAGSSLFTTDYADLAPLHLELSGPLAALARDRSPDPERRPATLRLEDGTTFEVTLKPRGKSRRQRSNCRFPPLWLRFEKDAIDQTLFAGHHRRKIVTHCQALTASSRDQSKVWLEMLAYRSLNLLTERSLRVKPLLIAYRDTAAPNKTYRHAAFLIEHKKELAQRVDLQATKADKVRRSSLDGAHANLAALFNLLIGNPDFSLTQGPADDDCCHNSVPLTAADGRVYPILYDFDNTGLVNPRYATTPNNLDLRSVRQRVYRGYCRHNDHIADGIGRMVAARSEIELLFNTHPLISSAEKKRATKYLGAFFNQYVESGDQQRRLVKRCLG